MPNDATIGVCGNKQVLHQDQPSSPSLHVLP